MDAFRLGLIDKDGKAIRKPRTTEEKSAFTSFHRLVFNLKRLLSQIPLGRTRIASYAAALYLLKEHGLDERDMLGMIKTEPGICLTESLSPNGHQDNWTVFPPESGSLGFKRSKMPQIHTTHRGPLTQFLLSRGIKHVTDSVEPKALRPTQSEYSPSKVEKARNYSGENRAILVSKDGYVLDGHHQWVAALMDRPEEKVKIIRFDCPIRQLIPHALEFPSVTVSECWYISDDGCLQEGDYGLRGEVPLKETGDLIGFAGSRIIVEEKTPPLGWVLGVPVYEALHVASGRKVIISQEDIIK